MIEALAADPKKGRRIDDIRPGYRKQAAGSHFIFYRLARPGIEIVRILHQSMDVEAHLRADPLTEPLRWGDDWRAAPFPTDAPSPVRAASAACLLRRPPPQWSR